ncbi:MAG TPA: carboxylating nicotinate-nucleotide diphosphorylase [Bacteroidia bacterium]|nr:carboxylating nicotinate-nucleotide diphosphorylase [Bacteroidia bacterium]
MKPGKKIPDYPIDFNKELDSLIIRTLKEDVGECDHTSFATIPANTKATGKLLVKDNGIIAGVEVARRIFNKVDKKIKLEVKIDDGQKIKKGDIVFTVSGNARSLLTAERLVLNYMQRMSGVATRAHNLSEMCKGTKAKILDTRKTTPGMRLLEKWAVYIGGAHNHRYGLYDMILIKDNHIHCSGGIKNAINNTHAYLKRIKKKLDIEIEAGSFDEVKEVLQVGGVQRILLDNFSSKEILKAVKLINGKYETEASGGITEKNLRQYALTGVDYLSLGALTHSVKSLDLSLKIFPKV